MYNQGWGVIIYGYKRTVRVYGTVVSVALRVLSLYTVNSIIYHRLFSVFWCATGNFTVLYAFYLKRAIFQRNGCDHCDLESYRDDFAGLSGGGRRVGRGRRGRFPARPLRRGGPLPGLPPPPPIK